MPNITHRIFGSDIPVRVKKRLEALQKMAERSHTPGEQIEDTAYKDERDGWYSYKELLGVDESNSSGYLSSKTPFVRMWTAVKLVVGKVEDTYESYFDVDFTDEDKKDGKTIRKNEHNKFEKIKYEGRGKPVIYQVGNHEFNQSRNPTESLQTDTGGLGIEGDFFHELKDNDFFKPQAGITSVNIETQGPLGAIKKTTVSFTVHNFKDYDEVYSRFFLRPAAQLVVDFGWNDGALYNPKEFLSGAGDANPDLEKEIEKFLKQRTRNGDVDIIIGNVTTFDTKITQEGSFECTLEILSKNTALFSDSLKDKTRKSIANNLELSVLDHIVYKATGGVVKVMDWTKTPTPKGDVMMALKKHSSTRLGREITDQEQMDGIRYGGEDFKSDIFISIGWLEDNMLNPRFGFINDVPNNDEGFNLEKNEKLEARFNSSNSFVTFDKNLYNRQRYGMMNQFKFLYPDKWNMSYSVKNNQTADFEAAYSKEVKVKYEEVPYDTEANDKANAVQGKIQELDHQIALHKDMIERSEGGENVYKAGTGIEYIGRRRSRKKIAGWEKDIRTLEEEKTIHENNAKKTTFVAKEDVQDYIYPDEGADNAAIATYNTVTDFDKMEKRMPLRELFISLDLVKRSLTESSNLSEMLTMILDEINTDSQDVFNLKFASNKYLGHELAIVDANHLNIQWEGRENTLFENLFQFKPLSPGSIVKEFDFSLTTPKDGFQNMMAISTLQSGQQYAPRDALSAQNQGIKVLSDNLDINALKGKAPFGPEQPDISVGFTYIPEIGRSNLLNRIQEDQMQGIIAMTFRDELKPEDITKSNLDIKTIYDHIAAGTESSVGVTVTKATSKSSGAFSEVHTGYNIEQPSGDVIHHSLPQYAGLLEDAKPDRLIKYQGSGIPRQILTSMKTYYEELARRTHYAEAPIILPVTLTLKIHGTGLLVPGDMFRVDYMPKRYLEHVYFQITKISHDVGSTWTTTLETTMRMRTMKKPGNIREMAELNSEIYLSPDIFTNTKEFPLFDINVDVMDEVRPMFGLVKDMKNIIGVFSFRANKNKKITFPKIPSGILQDTYSNFVTHGNEGETPPSEETIEITTNNHYFLIVNKAGPAATGGYLWTIVFRKKETTLDLNKYDIELLYQQSSAINIAALSAGQLIAE